jgi:hypothetical protein
LARPWRRSMPAAACDRAETKPKPKKTASQFHSAKRLQYFLNRSRTARNKSAAKTGAHLIWGGRPHETEKRVDENARRGTIGT